ncbi:MAG TPA: ATP-binding cassette domain-containing protein [Prolixibacteraceae bacterium]|nr:ATP-binding cassette domain-containing protein [Prolixibacteraceae bacterium]
MIHWKNAEIKIRTTRILENINLEIAHGEPLGIIGNNGTGKTILSKAIAGLIPVNGNTNGSGELLKKVYVPFQSSFQLRNGFTAYRQQRWNNFDSETVSKVFEELEYEKKQPQLDPLLDKFNFRKYLNNFVISLSNGEQRKMELIKALSHNPDLLILDNAYNGLDSDSRLFLSEMLDQMAGQKHPFILTGLKEKDFPKCINRFVLLEKGSTPKTISRSEIPPLNEPVPFDFRELPPWKNASFDELISVNNVSLKHGEKEILKNISWQVKAAEHWVLSGDNGSGKTSLLNLIFADNPKAYSCDIRLFGKQRGSGETIWDIKKKIGFISPELQQYLPKRQTALHVICSGLFDSEGLYIKLTTYQLSLAKQWLRLFGDLSWSEKLYNELSASEQRIVLIIRTLIKNPPLLLLDEPFQGLDYQNISKMKTLFNQIATQTNCAMVFVTHFRNEIPESFTLELKLKDGEMETMKNLQNESLSLKSSGNLFTV